MHTQPAGENAEQTPEAPSDAVWNKAPSQRKLGQQWLMDTCRVPFGRKILPGGAGNPAVSAPFKQARNQPKRLFHIYFRHWHGFCNSVLAAGSGDAGGEYARRTPGRRRPLSANKGGVTDAKCASGRPVAADVARARARRRRQQHRQHRHRGFQGRQSRVLRISDARRARRRVLDRQGSPHQLRAGSCHVDRHEPRLGPAHRRPARCRHRRQGLSHGANGARDTLHPQRLSSRSTPPASSLPATAIR